MRLKLYRNKLKYIELGDTRKSEEIILDKTSKTIFKDEYEFVLNSSNKTYQFKSDKKCAKEWIERINNAIDLL